MTESEFSNKLQRLWNMTPDAMKRGATCFSVAVGNMTFTANEYHKKVKPLTQLCTHIRNGQCVSPEMANSILNQCATNNTVVEQNRTGLYQALVEPRSVSSQQVTKHVEQVVRSTADILLGVSAIGSFLFVVMEAGQLWMVWNAIKDARNLVDKSPEKRAEISESLQKVLDEIKVLNGLVSQILGGSTEAKVTYQAMMYVDRIRSMLNDVQMSIKQLQVDIDKKKMSLLDVSHHTRMAAMTNTVTGVTTAANVILFWSNANPWLLGLNALLVVANGIMSIANVATCIITRQDLEKIEEEFQALDRLERERRNLMNTLEIEAQTLWKLIGAKP